MADIMLESASFACPKSDPRWIDPSIDGDFTGLSVLLPFSSFVCCRCRAHTVASCINRAAPPAHVEFGRETRKSWYEVARFATTASIVSQPDPNGAAAARKISSVL